MPATPAHSRPSATAQPMWPIRGTSRTSTNPSTSDRDDREHRGEPLALAEGRARVADQPQRQQAAEQPDRNERVQLGDRHDLGEDVGGQADDGNQREERSQPGAAGMIDGAATSGYRRSSRCLQVTHRVARGKACSRPLPIGWPQLSQLP